MKQRPLSACGYFPDLFLFGVDIPITRIAEEHGFEIESFWTDGLGPTDAVFVVLDSGSTFVIYRYEHGPMPDKTVIAGDPECSAPSELAEEIISAFGFVEEEIVMRAI